MKINTKVDTPDETPQNNIFDELAPKTTSYAEIVTNKSLRLIFRPFLLWTCLLLAILAIG